MISACAGIGRPVTGPGWVSIAAPLMAPAKSYSEAPSGRYSKPAMNSAGSSPLTTASGHGVPPAGVRIAHDQRAAGPDVGAAVLLVPERRRKSGEIDLSASH